MADSLSLLPHVCPAPSCSRLVRMDRILCAPHWFKLPLVMRGQLLAARRRWSGCSDPAKLLQRERAYRKKLEKALRYLDELDNPRSAPVLA